MALPLLLPPPSKSSPSLGMSSEGSRALRCCRAAPSPFPLPLPTLGGVRAAAEGWAATGGAWGLLPARDARPPSTQPLLLSHF